MMPILLITFVVLLWLAAWNMIGIWRRGWQAHIDQNADELNEKLMTLHEVTSNQSQAQSWVKEG